MPKILLKIHSYLYSQGKIKYLVFLFLSLISVIFESFGYISIVPLITVLINPDYLYQSNILQFINSFIQSSSEYDFIMKYGFICIFMFIFGSIFSFIQVSLQIRFVNSIILKTRQSLLKNYLNKDLSFHKKNNTTILISKLFTQIDEMATSVIFGFFEFINSTFLVIVFLLILSVADWKITISAMLFLSIFYFLIELNLKKKIKKVASTLYQNNIKALTYATEAIKLFKEISVEKQKNFFVSRFFAQINDIYKARNFVRIIPRFSRFMIETIGIGSIIVLILIIYSKERSVDYFLETIILFSISVYKIFPNLNKCFQISVNLKSGSQQFLNILKDTNEQPQINSLKFENNLFDKSIRLKDVNFFYDSKKILNNINITINKNDTILIYGKSGSGKSTICDIISGQLKINGGEILIDEKPINIFEYKNIKKFFGYVGQETLMLNENFYKNISLEENFNKSKVEQVAKIARIDEFINTKNDKYEEIITENGKNLSGGQKQRISIARALYQNPEILIIDEGTSNIDFTTEKEIYELIYENFPTKTKIIITHNLNSFIKYDYCFKIDKGQVIYDGVKAL